MLDDLRHLPRERDAFQLCDEDDAAAIFWILIIVVAIVL